MLLLVAGVLLMPPLPLPGLVAEPRLVAGLLLLVLLLLLP
jgi:hypothetical protein